MYEDLAEKIESISVSDFEALKKSGRMWVENSDSSIPESLQQGDFRVGFLTFDFDDAFANLGFRYARENYAASTLEDINAYMDWAEYGKEIGERLGYRCIEWDGEYYFFALERDDDKLENSSVTNEPTP